jgi:predicted MFS family arabinose efflux permease
MEPFADERAASSAFSSPAPVRRPMSVAARRITLVLLIVTYGFGFVDRVVIALVAQGLKADFGLSDLEIGLLGGTAFAVVNTLAIVPIARLAERFPRKIVIAGSLFVGSVCTAACAATTSFAQLLVARLGMAIGAAGTEAPSHSVISDMYPAARRASALSLFMLGVPIASIAGSFAGGSVGQAYGWRATFLLFGLLGIAVSVLGLFLMREPARSDVSVTDGAAGGPSLTAVAKRLWSAGHFRFILFGTALVSLASFGVNTFLPAFFSRSYGLGAGDAGLAFGLVAGIASAVGSLVGGFGSERLARGRPERLMLLPGLGLLVGAPLLMLGVTRDGLVAAVPIILVASIFFYTAMAPAIAATHALLDSTSRATGSALFALFIHLIGQGVGAPLAGFLSDRFAGWVYGAGDFARECAGAAAQIGGSACAAASSAGLRYTIICFAAIYLLGAISYLLAVGRMRGDRTIPTRGPVHG